MPNLDIKSVRRDFNDGSHFETGCLLEREQAHDLDIDFVLLWNAETVKRIVIITFSADDYLFKHS